MRKIILTILIIFTAFSVNISAEELNIQKNTVSISFDFSKKLRLASNQFAVWVENENGEPVEKGIYKIFIEANIKWENTVLFTCEIKIDDNITIGEITEKISGKDYNKQTLIKNVEIK